MFFFLYKDFVIVYFNLKYLYFGLPFKVITWSVEQFFQYIESYCSFSICKKKNH